MKSNMCRINCVLRDFSANKVIFRPKHKNCIGCEYLKKRVLDKSLNELIKEQEAKGKKQ